MNITPAVPWKIEAGWKFQRRNPSSPPARTKHRTATNGWATPVVRLRIPSVSAAMSAIPVDSPSRPSMKLMLLIIPTTQTTVNADGERRPERDRCPGPNGLLDGLDPDAEGDGHAGQGDLPQELPAGAEVEQVVDGTDERGQGAADEQREELAAGDRAGRRHRTDLLVEHDEPAADDDERHDDGDPPAARDRAWC